MSTSTNLSRATSVLTAPNSRKSIFAEGKTEGFFKKPSGEIVYLRDVDRREEYKNSQVDFANAEDTHDEALNAHKKAVEEWTNTDVKTYENDRSSYELAMSDWHKLDYRDRYARDDKGEVLYPQPVAPAFPHSTRPPEPEPPQSPDYKWRKVMLFLSIEEKEIVYIDDNGDTIVNHITGWKAVSQNDVLIALNAVVNSSDQYSSDFYTNRSSSGFMDWVNILIPEDEKHKYPSNYMDARQQQGFEVKYFGYGVFDALTEFVDEKTREIDKMLNDPLSFAVSRRYTLGRILGERVAFPFLARLHAKSYQELNQESAERKEELLNTSPDQCPEIPNLKKGVEFYPHQALSLAVLDKTDTAILDISMGGGKTLILLSDALNMILSGKCKRPLFLMPNSTLGQQKAEIEEFTNNRVNVCVINSDTFRAAGSDEVDRQAWFEVFAEEAPPNTIYLSSYAFIRKKITVATGERKVSRGKWKEVTEDICPHAQWLIDGLKIDYVALDESHKIKNTDSVTYKAAMALSEAPIRRIASGTVIPNSPTDLLAQTRFLDPNILGTEREFIKEYAEKVDGRGKVKQWQPGALKSIRNKLLEAGGVSIRRSHWMHLLPKRVERVHIVKMSPIQQKVYNQLLNDVLREVQEDAKLKAALKKVEESGEEVTEYPALLAKLSKLDTYICAPDTSSLIQHSAVEEQISPKVPRINRILREHFAMDNPGKVLVFVKSKASARHIIEGLEPDFKKHAVYYAATDGAIVKANLGRFKGDNEVKILVGVDQSLREGQNLQMANRIIRADLHWNPGDMEQSYARAWRPKQQRTCYIDLILCDNSIEVPKYARCVSKQHIQRKVDSNFEDDEELEIVMMNMYTINTMTQASELTPYIERVQAIKEAEIRESEAITEKYGFTMVPRRMDGVISDSETIRTPVLARTNILPPVYKLYVDKGTFKNKKVLMIGAYQSLEVLEDRDASKMGFRWSEVLDDGAWWIPYPSNIKEFKANVLAHGYKMVWTGKKKIPEEFEIGEDTAEIIDMDSSIFDLMEQDHLDYEEQERLNQLERRRELAEVTGSNAAIRILYSAKEVTTSDFSGYESRIHISGLVDDVERTLKSLEKSTFWKENLKNANSSTYGKFMLDVTTLTWSAWFRVSPLSEDATLTRDFLVKATELIKKRLLSRDPSVSVIVSNTDSNDPLGNNKFGFAPASSVFPPSDESIQAASRVVDGEYLRTTKKKAKGRAGYSNLDTAKLVAKRAHVLWTVQKHHRHLRNFHSSGEPLTDNWYERSIEQLFFEDLLTKVAPDPEANLELGEGAADPSSDDDDMPGTSVKKPKKTPKKKEDKKLRLPIYVVLEERSDILYLTLETDTEGAPLIKTLPEFVRRHGFAMFPVKHRQEAMRMIERVKKKGLSISNEFDLVADVKRTQRLKGRKKDVEYKQMVRERTPDFEVEMLFGTVNTESHLFVWLTEAAQELAKLKQLGWTATFPFYEAVIENASLSKFVRLIKKMDKKGVYFENFEEFRGAIMHEFEVDLGENFSHLEGE